MRRYAGLETGTADERKLGYLLFISRKCGFPPDEFFRGLIEACEEGFFELGELRIERCAEDEEYANVRVIFRGRIVAQTRLRLDIVLSEREWTFYDAFSRRSAPTPNDRTLRVCDLCLGMQNVTLTATVARRPVIRHGISRFTSLPIQFTSVSVTDDTGEIQLLLRKNEQLPKIVKGMVLKIDKGYVRNYLGVKQLRIRSGVGKITVVTSSAAPRPSLS